jgi:hypothetical protein
MYTTANLSLRRPATFLKKGNTMMTYPIPSSILLVNDIPVGNFYSLFGVVGETAY